MGDTNKISNYDRVIFIVVALSITLISVSMLLWVFSSPIKKEIIKVDGGNIYLFLTSEDVEALFIPDKKEQ